MLGCKRKSVYADSETCVVLKEWDEAVCPVCMEHPHNAVLLLCSSHAKGCRPYICDTSYRHSNCLDRYRKIKADSSPQQQNASNSSAAVGRSMYSPDLPQGRPEAHAAENLVDHNHTHTGETPGSQESSEKPQKTELKCPLCRGDVHGWKVVEDARTHLNSKPRGCSRESCSFVGNYRELRRHARCLHPTARPAEIDPTRQRAWRRFEHQREYDDIVTAIQSAIPGAVVVGDYVIENGNSDRNPTDRGRSSGEGDGQFFTTFFLFQMLGSMDSRSRSRAGTWSRHRRSTDEGSNSVNSRSGDFPPRRRRRRLTRTRFSRDQP